MPKSMLSNLPTSLVSPVPFNNLEAIGKMNDRFVQGGSHGEFESFVDFCSKKKSQSIDLQKGHVFQGDHDRTLDLDTEI